VIGGGQRIFDDVADAGLEPVGHPLAVCDARALPRRRSAIVTSNSAKNGWKEGVGSRPKNGNPQKRLQMPETGPATGARP
jgi:hypothetical protein